MLQEGLRLVSKLSYFVDNVFKAADMARMLGISDATAHRRLKDFNLQISLSFSIVDNNTIYGIVRSIKEEFLISGYRMVCGVLRVSTLSWWNWRLWMYSEMVPPTTQLNFLLNLSTLASWGLVDKLELELCSSSLTTCQGGFCIVLIDLGQSCPR